MSEREDVRRLVQELLQQALANGDGPAASVPPAPVAAVLRPSTWSQPAAPGEVIGKSPGGGESPGGDSPASSLREHRGDGVVAVTISSDADLDAFVRQVLDHGDAIRAGRLRFTLSGGGSAGVMRVAHGAVTERKIKQAADAGARLVLGPGAVLTPLARDKARALGVEIERER
jgi:hypothetical protein